jgi:hypothetical protein
MPLLVDEWRYFLFLLPYPFFARLVIICKIGKCLLTLQTEQKNIEDG